MMEELNGVYLWLELFSKLHTEKEETFFLKNLFPRFHRNTLGFDLKMKIHIISIMLTYIIYLYAILF